MRGKKVILLSLLVSLVFIAGGTTACTSSSTNNDSTYSLKYKTSYDDPDDLIVNFFTTEYKTITGADEGDIVLVEVYTDSSYEVDKIYYNDIEILETYNNENYYMFSMPSSNVVITIDWIVKHDVTYDTSSTNYTIDIDSGTAYELGSTVEFRVIPSTGKSVTTVTISNGGKVVDNGDNTYSFIMPSQDIVIDVSTTNTYYTVSYQLNDDYTISELEASYVYGETVEFEVYPSKGKNIIDVSLSSGETLQVNDDNTYSFTMPDENVTINVDVENIIYNVSYDTSNSDYSISGLDSTYTYGETVKFTIDTTTGKEVSAVTYNGEDATKLGDNTYSFSMPDDDVTLVVGLEDGSYVVGYETSDYYTINGIETSYGYGETVEFSITLANSYLYVKDISLTNGDTIQVNGENTYSFTMPDERVWIEVDVTYTDEFMETYGNGNMYSSSNGLYLHVSTDTAYYIDDSVTGDFYEAVMYVIKEANKLTDAIEVTATDDSSSNFKIQVQNRGANGENGVNNYRYYESSRRIIGATITLNSYYLGSNTYTRKMGTTMHEILHTFGFRHASSTATSLSVMGSSYLYKEYPLFDKLCVKWYYG